MSKEEIKVNHRYMSVSEYAKQVGLGVEEVKKMIRRKEIPGHITKNNTKYPHYRVRVDLIENSVPREKYEEALKRIVELETKLNLIHNASKI